MVEVVLVKKVTDEIYEAIKNLMPQLSEDILLKRDILEKTVSTEGTYLFIAKSEGNIVGTATVVTFYIPTGLKARIEDVVTDSSVRGKGIGEKLMYEALSLTRKLKIAMVDLTTNPSRKAANRLYAKLGFIQRETNVYRYTN